MHIDEGSSSHPQSRHQTTELVLIGVQTGSCLGDGDDIFRQAAKLAAKAKKGKK